MVETGCISLTFSYDTVLWLEILEAEEKRGCLETGKASNLLRACFFLKPQKVGDGWRGRVAGRSLGRWQLCYTVLLSDFLLRPVYPSSPCGTLRDSTGHVPTSPEYEHWTGASIAQSCMVNPDLHLEMMHLRKWEVPPRTYPQPVERDARS